MNLFRKSYLYGCTTAAALAFPSFVLAETGDDTTTPTITVSTLVQPEGIESGLVSNLADWAVIGLAIGVAVVVLSVGWKFLKRFMRG